MIALQPDDQCVIIDAKARFEAVRRARRTDSRKQFLVLAFQTPQPPQGAA